MTRLDKIIQTQSISTKEQKQNKQIIKPSFEEFLFRALANGKDMVKGGNINGKNV